MIVYFHGFGASESTKADELKRLGLEVVAPIYRNYEEFIQAGRVAMETIGRSTDPVQMVVGSSLGGFLAYYISLYCHTRGVLVNPCMEPATHLAGYPGMTDEWVEWLKKVKVDVEGGLLKTSDAHLTAIVNMDDERLGDTWDKLPLYGIFHTVCLAQGGHQASNWPEIAAKIKEFHDELELSVKLQNEHTN